MSAGAFDMSSSPDMSEARRPYDGGLAAPRDVPGECPSAVVAQEGALTGQGFVMSFRLQLDDATSQERWRERVHELIWTQVMPCRDPSKPALVVFPEGVGLPMVLIGQKAAAARSRAQSSAALAMMASALAGPLEYYRALYPDAPIARQLLLAATDTVARATLDTFAQLARRYNLYIAVSLYGARWEREERDEEVIRALADSDYDAPAYAWRAASSQATAKMLVFGPDGSQVMQADKIYLSPQERGVLQLSAGDLRGVRVVKTPMGRVGAALGADGHSPDIQDRLDDLGAQLVLHAQSYQGGWARYVDEGDARQGWLPDQALMGAWNMAQRGARGVAQLVSHASGNFLELSFDGQAHVAERAGRRRAQLVGQRGPLAGLLFVAPWSGEEVSGTLMERRDRLMERAASLLPGSGDEAEGQHPERVWGVSLAAPLEQSVQTHPALARLGELEVVVASEGEVGARQIKVRRLEGGAQHILAKLGYAGYDLIRPQAVTDTDGALHLICEAVGAGVYGEVGDEAPVANRLLYARLEAGASAFEGVELLSMSGSWAYHPSLAISGSTLHLGWAQHVRGATRVFYAQGSTSKQREGDVLSAFGRAMPLALDVSEVTSAEVGNQWDVQVAASGQRVAAVWLRRGEAGWEVRGTVSQDAGLSWASPARLDGAPGHHSEPRLIALPTGGFLATWVQLDGTMVSSARAVRRMWLGLRSELMLGEHHLLGGGDDPTRWARSGALRVEHDMTGSLGTSVQLVWAEQLQEQVSLREARYLPGLDRVMTSGQSWDARGGASSVRLLSSSAGAGGWLVYESAGALKVVQTQGR